MGKKSVYLIIGLAILAVGIVAFEIYKIVRVLA